MIGRVEKVTTDGIQTLLQAGSDVDVLRDVEGFVGSYVHLPKGAGLAVAAWILATYLFAEFDVFPYLGITSPVARCGKSTLLGCVGLLAWNAIPAANISEAGLFRTIEEDKPTLLLDEIEWVKQDSERAQIMKNLLNAGHRCDAVTIRCEKSGERKRFSVFCPKALSAIGELSQTLADRSIRVQLQRKTQQEEIRRFRFRQVRSQAATIKQRLAEWAKRNQEIIRETYEEMPDLPFLDDRGADNWCPLFTVVSVADFARLGELRQAAESLSRDRGDMAADESLPLRLLLDFRRVASSYDADFVPTKVLIEEAKKVEDSPWFGDEVKLTARKAARWLRGFGITPVRTPTVRGYETKRIIEAGERYSPKRDDEQQDVEGVTHEASEASSSVSPKSLNNLPMTDMTVLTDEVSRQGVRSGGE